MVVEDPYTMRIIGSTIDDAAGEAFDKTGKLLGLPYPAGPFIDKWAKEGQARFSFSEPQIPGYDFSFSGLKTNILRFMQQNTKDNPQFIQDNLADICASVQGRIVSILMNKLVQAAEDLGITEVAIAGGVSANSGLRKALEETAAKKGWRSYIPRFEYCTDNAAMIGMAAHFKYLRSDFVDQSVAPLARMPY
jgi:N6-L-threonylcarbamoyladenine synthase